MIDTRLRHPSSAVWGELVSFSDWFHQIITTNITFRLSDVKKVLVPLISGKKLSTQIVGSSSPKDDGETGAGNNQETFLSFHDGVDLQAKPSSWKETLNTYPVIHIQK